MLEQLSAHPALLGLCAGLITWIFTSVGAATVFLQKEFSKRTLDILLGFAAGVMLAASIWSLILPGLEIAEGTWGHWKIVPVAMGFILGGIVLRLIDFILPHIHPGANQTEGIGSKKLPRNLLLILAITLHNIPEAGAVGVAFGAAAIDPQLGMVGAITLMLGIGIQNLPEGMAVSIPLMREGWSRKRAFFYGQLSGLVEPIAAVAGALLASIAINILPWVLSFAAGAMIFVTIEEVIPETHSSGNSDAATMGAMLGFICMMALDVFFG